MEKMILQKIKDIPMTSGLDTVIIGNSLAAVSAACKLGEEGYNCCLITYETYLGYEIAGCNRPWINYEQNSEDILRKYLKICDGDYQEFSSLHFSLYSCHILYSGKTG